MPSDFSFDIVSDYDHQELLNAVDQTRREMVQRYDLKQAGGQLDIDGETLAITAPSDMTLRAIADVLETKMVRRGIDLKVLSFQAPEPASGGSVRQSIVLRKGISQELAKELTKVVRDTVPKARAQVQGNSVRVSSKSKDDLQRIISAVKQRNYEVPLQFVNYR
jgi:cyclic-di-GMP-binding protein